MPSPARISCCRFLAGLAALSTVLVLAPREGWADVRAEARNRLVQGGEFLKRGQFEDALARFQEAYRLVPSPKIQYNFGLAYRGLGRKADALEAFERFLAEAPDATKETRQNAARERAQLVGQITTLEVKVDLPGAEIFVDGRSYGTTRSTPIYLDPGPHQLMVEKSGEGPAYNERINASPGQRISVMARLARTASAEPPPLHDPQPAPAPRPVIETLPPRGDPPRPNRQFTEFNRDTTCGGKLAQRGGPHCSDLYDGARSARTLQIVGFAVAGALAATSVVLFVLTPDRPAESVSLACAPSLANPGLACVGHF
jgi:hypothetical protein